MMTGKHVVATEILRVIKETPRLTPIEIAEQTRISTQYVRNTLRVLTELQLVETPARGVYLITKLGISLLNSLHKK